MEKTVDVPITEMSNELSQNIDISSPEQMMCILRQCDYQIFAGWKHFQGLYDPATLAVITRIAESAYEVLQTGSGRGHVVLSGCGTSGRLAFVIARTFNTHLEAISRPAHFHYLVAGGDAALLKSEEAVEDSWWAGSQDLVEITADMERVLFIGISCGLSAPYVAGQLDYCMQHSDKFAPVLLGFNPTSLARRSPIRDCSKVFCDVVAQMKSNDYLILNPVIGPEALTGSTRMKGGSATKILLEVIFTMALEKIQHNTFKSSAVALLQAYELTCSHTYTTASQSIAVAMDMAGKCLQSGGHVYYLGMGTPGVMAIVDASECPPTFGVQYGTVRGYIAGGYTTLRNTAGSLATMGSDYDLAISSFNSSVLPHVTETDCIVTLIDPRVALEVGLPWIPPSNWVSCRPHTVAVLVCTDDMPQINTSVYDHTVLVRLPWKPLSWYWSRDISRDLLLEAAVKWILNAISTGANIISGKVLGNRMIDLQVSNSKLYHRAVGIVQTFSGVDVSMATECLLTAIYGECTSNRGNSISQHVAMATGLDKVVPTALLLSTGLYSVDTARQTLRQTPIVRQILAQTKHLSNDI